MRLTMLLTMAVGISNITDDKSNKFHYLYFRDNDD